MFFSSACGDIHNDLWNHLSRMSSDKQITSFEINGYKARISGLTVNSVLPYGTSVKALKPQITHNGYSISPESGETQDFTNPVSYTVTASDGTMAVYTVSVKVLTVAEMSNANLSSLRVKKGKLQPALNSTDVDYLDAPIPFSDSENPAYNDKQSNSLIADAEILIATMTMELENNGEVSVENATEKVFPSIKVGSNVVTVTVTAADKTTKKTYKLNMYRAVPIFKTGAGNYTGINEFEDGATQRGVSGPSVRFTNNGDGTVTDNMTGLMWSKNINLIAGSNLANAVSVTSSMFLGGNDDWRLPNVKEIMNLRSYDNKFIDNLPTYFDGKNESSKWWTSTVNTSVNDIVFCFSDPNYIAWTPSGSNLVWAVREIDPLLPILPKTGSKPQVAGDDGNLQRGVEWPNPRFYKDESGAIVDNMTSLMWFEKQYDGSTYGYVGLVNYCKNTINKSETVYHGFYDWVIPNVREIETLSNFGEDDILWLKNSPVGLFDVRTDNGVGNPIDIWTSTIDPIDSGNAYCYDTSLQVVKLIQKATPPCDILPVRLIKPSEMTNY